MLEKSKIVLPVILLYSIWLGSISNAQQKTVKDGVFTEAQAAAGQTVYDRSCMGCHPVKFYTEILRARRDRPLIDLWYSIIGEMPQDNPGSLLDQEYTDVLAYILSENGFPSGDTALDPNNGMEQINIVSP